MERNGKRWAGTFFNLCLVTASALTLFFFSLLLWPQGLIPWISSLGIHHGAVNHGKILTSQTMAEVLGYQELGQRVRTDCAALSSSKSRGVFVFTDSYSLSSIISFYAKTDAKTLLFTSTGGDYDRWNRFEQSVGEDALYVDTQAIGTRPDIDQILHRAFASVEALPPLTVRRGSIQTGTFYFAHCKSLIHPEALRPNWPW